MYNTIALLSLNHFNALPKTGKPTTKEWTVLSTIVQENTNLKENTPLSVVALGTGSKCIGSSKMCPNGTILNDSHGEIICRRAFIRYMCNEMNNSDSDVLTFHANLNKFKLKDGIKFHFFTTHVPCGDAAIFPKQNSEYFGDCLNTGNKRKGNNNEDVKTSTKKRKTNHSENDIFRTGAKCLSNDSKDSLEPDISYITGVVRTKPGRGDPTLSLSCSDKIAIWCHLGIQGALLSILLDKPVYLDTFIIVENTPFDINAAKRAFWERITEIESLPAHVLDIHQIDAQYNFVKTEEKRPSSASIIYAKNCKLEISVDGKKQGITRKNKNLNCATLSISKVSLFKMFLDVVFKYKIKIPSKIPYVSLEGLTYGEIKCFSNYSTQKKLLLETGFNVCMRKRNNLLQFKK